MHDFMINPHSAEVCSSNHNIVYNNGSVFTAHERSAVSTAVATSSTQYVSVTAVGYSDMYMAQCVSSCRLAFTVDISLSVRLSGNRRKTYDTSILIKSIEITEMSKLTHLSYDSI